VRVLNIGGDDLTDGVAGDPAAAGIGSQPSQAAGPVAGTMVAAARSAVGSRMRVLVEDIRGSLDFYLAQADTDRVDRVVVTGGAALAEGFLAKLQEGLGRSVEIADPLSTVALGKTGLSEEELRHAAPYMVTPIGLALWGSVAGRPISLLPDEVLKARRQRRQATAIGCAVLAFAAALGLVGVGRMAQVTAAQDRAAKAEALVTSLNGQFATVSDVTRVQADVRTQQALYASALGHEVDWIRLMQQVTAVMPPGVHLASLTVVRQITSATAVAGTTAVDGTLTMGVVAAGGPGSAADWLRALATLPGLQGTTVQTITQALAPLGVTFGSTSFVTTAAESQRSVQAGAKQ
jgi:Tfp pilus assembly protein PilN